MSAPFISILSIFSLVFSAAPTESGRRDGSPDAKLPVGSPTVLLKLGPKSKKYWGGGAEFIAFSIYGAVSRSHTCTVVGKKVKKKMLIWMHNGGV